MERTRDSRELKWIVGAYGPLGRIPLLEDYIGESLLDMVVIACAKLGFPSGILQNDGKLFPAPPNDRFQLFTRYCRAIRETDDGHERCMASDCQGVMKFTGGDKAEIMQRLKELMKRSPISEMKITVFPDERVRCYICHAGLVELIRPICLDFENGTLMPIGAIWAGQKKVKGYSLSDDEVRRVAKEIGYRNAENLLMFYKGINPQTGKEFGKEELFMELSEEGLIKFAKELEKTARSLEDAASKSFRIKKPIDHTKTFP